MRISVTADDIAAHKASDCWRCAASRAPSRAFGTTAVVTGYGYMLVGSQRYAMPNDAIQFVADADVGRPLQPITFDVELIP